MLGFILTVSMIMQHFSYLTVSMISCNNFSSTGPLTQSKRTYTKGEMLLCQLGLYNVRVRVRVSNIVGYLKDVDIKYHVSLSLQY